MFISPNTRENLNFSDALENLNSQEEISLIRKAREIGCAVGINSRIVKALGSWSDGIEHSTIIKARTNEATLRYLASRLGKHAQQKAVLYFRRNSSGTGRMYILFIPRFKNDETGIIKALDREGVAYRTLVPEKKRTLIYIVDLKNELGHRIAAVSGRLRAHLLLLRGIGAFVGDETDRDKAANIFGQEIHTYEATHKLTPRRCARAESNRQYGLTIRLFFAYKRSS